MCGKNEHYEHPDSYMYNTYAVIPLRLRAKRVATISSHIPAPPLGCRYMRVMFIMWVFEWDVLLAVPIKIKMLIVHVEEGEMSIG